MEGDDKVFGFSSTRFVSHAGVEPVVLPVLGRLVVGAFIVRVADPQAGRIPERSLPLIRTAMRGVILDPQVGCGRRIGQPVHESVKGIHDPGLAAAQ